MQPLSHFSLPATLSCVLTDIDDTLTTHGQLPPATYKALWDLHHHNFHVIPITGRPAGWCEMIARLWPVTGIIGENGAFYFRYHKNKMQRHFVSSHFEKNRRKLQDIEKDILQKIPGVQPASDQFCRLCDLAIDFCEDVPPIPKKDIQRIVEIFQENGAQARISSIHVNGWFGDYNKVSTTRLFLEKELFMTPHKIQEQCAFVGDSPNDEPLFAFLSHTFGVANINRFASEMAHTPQFVATKEGGEGFVQIVKAILGASH